VDWKKSDWYGLYRERWGKEIVPDAYAHPAKYARGLIRRIYRHLLDQGYILPGDTVLDPFAGVALGALDAQRNGLNWWGNELEEKFVKLGMQNLVRWDNRYRRLWPDTWGSASLTMGDSRELVKILARRLREIEVLQGVVSSPPHSTSSAPPTSCQGYEAGSLSMNEGDGQAYGDSPGQLAAMPEGDVEAVVSSPPYAGSMSQHDGANDADARLQRKDTAGFDISEALIRSGPHSQQNQPQRYSDNPANLGNMSAVVSSPPYASSVNSKQHGIDWDKAGSWRKGRRRGEGTQHEQTLRDSLSYSDTPENLGNMPDGDISAVITSPPFGAGETRDRSPMSPGHVADCITRAYTQDRQGTTAGNLAHLETDEEGLEAVISSPPYSQRTVHGQAGIDMEKLLGNTTGLGSQIYTQDQYGNTEGQLGTMKEGNLDAAVTSPPYRSGGHHSGVFDTWGGEISNGKGGCSDWAKRDIDYGQSPGQMEQMGSEDNFWTAARAIVDQCYLLLKPGAVAVWVVKRFVRDKQIVEFPDQWRRMCEAAGFETVEWIRAWVVEEHGAQQDLFGNHHPRKVERKSFFRRLYESKYPENSIDWEDVIIMRKKEAPC